MSGFVNSVTSLSRKDAAMSILGAYGQTGRKGMAFTLLDGNTLDNKAWKTLVMQCLK